MNCLPVWIAPATGLNGGRCPEEQQRIEALVLQFLRELQQQEDSEEDSHKHPCRSH